MTTSAGAQGAPIMIPAWVDGVLTPVEKLEVHRRGLKHRAVSVFVVRDGALLLQQRAAAKYHTPGLWANACCTHPHWEESDADCARRRLREELGIDGLELEHRGAVEYRAPVGPDLVEHEVAEIFVGTAGPDIEPAPDPDEVQATRWIGTDALAAEIAAAPDRFTPWLRIYLAEHHETIFAKGVLAPPAAGNDLPAVAGDASKSAMP